MLNIDFDRSVESKETVIFQFVREYHEDMKETGAIRLTNKDKPNPILLFFLFVFFFVNEMYCTMRRFLDVEIRTKSGLLTC